MVQNHSQDKIVAYESILAMLFHAWINLFFVICEMFKNSTQKQRYCEQFSGQVWDRWLQWETWRWFKLLHSISMSSRHYHKCIFVLEDRSSMVLTHTQDKIVAYKKYTNNVVSCFDKFILCNLWNVQEFNTETKMLWAIQWATLR